MIFSLCKFSWTLTLLSSFWKKYLGIKNGISINLIEFRIIITTVRIDIVRLEVLTIHKTTRSWSGICIAIRVEGWLAKVCCHWAIWKQSSLCLQFLDFLKDNPLLFFSKFSIKFLLLCSSSRWFRTFRSISTLAFIQLTELVSACIRGCCSLFQVALCSCF